jgi:hypothetical protein
MTALLLLIVVASAVWVGVDAQTRDFSDHRFARSTTQWVIGMLGLWIVAFPVYLVARGKVPLRGAPPSLAATPPLADGGMASGSVAPPGSDDNPSSGG